MDVRQVHGPLRGQSPLPHLQRIYPVGAGSARESGFQSSAYFGYPARFMSRSVLVCAATNA